MDAFRREFLKRAGIGIAAAAAGIPSAASRRTNGPVGNEAGSFDVRSFGATGDGIDTAVVNRGIDAAAAGQ